MKLIEKQNKQESEFSSIVNAQFRILIIDDCSYLSKVNNQGFRNYGAIVYVADDYQKAFKILNSRAIDVVSVNLDFNDGYLGFEILSKLYNKLSNKLNLIWTVSYLSQSNEKKQKIKKLGIELFFHQPVSTELFIKKIHEYNNQQVRSNDRVFVNGQVSLYIDGNYELFALKDVSLTGFAVTCKKLSFAIDDLVSAVIASKNSSMPIRVNAKVVRASENLFTSQKAISCSVNSNANANDERSEFSDSANCDLYTVGFEYIELNKSQISKLNSFMADSQTTMSKLTKELNEYDHAN